MLLAAKRVDPLPAALDGHPPLSPALVAEVVEVEHFADFVEAEADALAAQDPAQRRPVAIRIEARGAAALRRDEPLVVVEAQRPGRYPERLAKLADGMVGCATGALSLDCLAGRRFTQRSPRLRPA